MKDNFSSQAAQYAIYRPVYPAALFKYLETQVAHKNTAWDCGTGNGQVAKHLSHTFRRVEATDISSRQMENAYKASNIIYSNQPAEETTFPSGNFDLITVAQAIHWFNFEAFYREVERTLKTGGLLAVIGYSLFKSNPETNAVIENFYNNIIGPYWDPERKYLDEEYNTIPFHFNELEVPQFTLEVKWTFDHLVGYLKTWSAVKHFETRHNFNPVDLIQNDLNIAFGDEGKIVFPILFRLGRKGE